MFDVDQLDRVFDIKGNGDNVISVEIAVEDPGRNGVAIQTNQEIKEGRPVTDERWISYDALERGSLLRSRRSCGFLGHS